MKSLLKALLVRLLERPLHEMVDQAVSDIDTVDAAELAALRGELASANAELERMTVQLEQTVAALDAARAESPPPAPTTNKAVCKVDGCSGEVRSRGFCGKHYAAWRRGRLDGFVGPKGKLVHGQRTWTLSPDLAGQAYAVKAGRILVGESVVGAA